MKKMIKFLTLASLVVVFTVLVILPTNVNAESQPQQDQNVQAVDFSGQLVQGASYVTCECPQHPIGCVCRVKETK